MASAETATWTWIHPSGSLHRNDFIISRGRGNKGNIAHSLFDAPVSLGGYRDHRPVQAIFCPGATFNFQPKQTKLPSWNRPLLQQAYSEMITFDQKLHAGEQAEKSELISAVLGMRSHIAHHCHMLDAESVLANPSAAYAYLENEVVENAIFNGFAAKTVAPKFQPELSSNTLTLVRTKQFLQKQLASFPPGLMQEQYEHVQRLFRNQVRVAKKAIRKDKRTQLENYAAEAELAHE
eukprot:5477109-Karenia_brevis.AAC.1